MSKKKAFDPKAREKRAKIIVLGGSLLLVVLLGIQLPGLMKGGAPAEEAAAPAPVLTPVGATTPTAATTLPALPGGAASGALPVSDAPQPAEGQLASFGLFASKDPFQQQVDVPDQPAEESSGAGSADAGSDDPSLTEGVTAADPSAATATPLPGVKAGKPVSATISINGVPEAVNVGGDFPAASPVFHLLALTAKSAKIAIVGGSYESGAPAVTLRRGKSLTLMNTADGTRYELRLESVSASPAVPAVVTTETTTTDAAATTEAATTATTETATTTASTTTVEETTTTTATISASTIGG